MKKFVLTAVFLSVSLTGFAQDAKQQETKYRRSSLYMIMLPDDKLEKEQKEIVAKAFLEKSFPDKYNDHCLKERVLDLAKVKSIEVTQEEIDAAEKEGASSGKKKLGGLLKSIGKKVSSGGGEQNLDQNSDAAYVARMQKYFKANKTAQKMVAKWLGGGEEKPKAAKPMSQALIEERGIQTLSTDEINLAKQAGNFDEVRFSAMMDLMPKTFVLVNRYSYLSAEEIIAYITAAASMVGGGYAQLAGAGLAAVLKGYFVKTSTFLFQLDLDRAKIEEMATKYTSDISGVYSDDSYKLKYIGKTWDYAPAALKLSLKKDALEKLISRATTRATDGAIAKLQKKYEQFKTLSTLHQDGKNLYAYIGMKEGVKKGDKFEVLQKTINKKGEEVFEVVKTVKVEKDGLWDNREGAGEIIEGAAQSKDDDESTVNLTYTKLGTSKDFLEGSLIRQVK